MYKVTVNGEFAGYSDTAVFIRLAGNGAFVPCEAPRAQGVCVKLPVEIAGEDGSAVKTVGDTVFSLPGQGLPGVEDVAELEETSGPVELAKVEEIVNILIGGEES